MSLPEKDWEQRIITYFTLHSLQTDHLVFIILVQTQSGRFAPLFYTQF